MGARMRFGIDIPSDQQTRERMVQVTDVICARLFKLRIFDA